jgi:Flp pilus assembly protein TadG
MDMMKKHRLPNERGAALLEVAITLPIVLLVSVGIFEFGRAYQTAQVLTNAAREGARVSILIEQTDLQVDAAVRNYMKSGRIPDASKDPSPITVGIERSVAFGGNTASRITITYPFNFMVLNSVVRLVRSASQLGDAPLTLTAVAMMRNES